MCCKILKIFNKCYLLPTLFGVPSLQLYALQAALLTAPNVWSLCKPHSYSLHSIIKALTGTSFYISPITHHPFARRNITSLTPLHSTPLQFSSPQSCCSQSRDSMSKANMQQPAYFMLHSIHLYYIHICMYTYTYIHIYLCSYLCFTPQKAKHNCPRFSCNLWHDAISIDLMLKHSYELTHIYTYTYIHTMWVSAVVSPLQNHSFFFVGRLCSQFIYPKCVLN